jgi:putative ABC transport system permease protein
VFLRALIFGSAIVALVVAALAVANTMVTAVVERRREIGLRRVVGATRGQVVASSSSRRRRSARRRARRHDRGRRRGDALNVVTERMGAQIFLLTPRLVLAAILLPSLLAAVAGFVPARRAARLVPADALRYV